MIGDPVVVKIVCHIDAVVEHAILDIFDEEVWWLVWESLEELVDTPIVTVKESLISTLASP